MADVTMKPCGDCGMPCTPAEYHPYAACLMFKACHNSATVRANLPDYEALRKRCEAVEADAARYRWLRDNRQFRRTGSFMAPAFVRVEFCHYSRDLVEGPSLDSAIDQAIAAAQEPSHG